MTEINEYFLKEYNKTNSSNLEIKNTYIII